MITMPAKVEDLFHVELRPEQESEDIRAWLPPELTDEVLNAIAARTIWHEGRVLACYGLTPCRPGVAEAWAYFSPESLRYPKSLFRMLKEDLAETIEREDLRRVQAVTRDGFAEGARLLVHLGFELEGRMRAFGPNGEDFLLFARIRNGCGG